MLEDFVKLVGGIVILAGVAIGEWFLESWWLMLAVGDIHRNWWPQVPLMGWDAALPVGYCLAAFIAVPVTVAIATRRKK